WARYSRTVTLILSRYNNAPVMRITPRNITASTRHHVAKSRSSLIPKGTSPAARRSPPKPKTIQASPARGDMGLILPARHWGRRHESRQAWTARPPKPSGHGGFFGALSVSEDRAGRLYPCTLGAKDRRVVAAAGHPLRNTDRAR